MPKSPSMVSEVACTTFPRSSCSAKKVTQANVQTRQSICFNLVPRNDYRTHTTYLSYNGLLFLLRPLKFGVPAMNTLIFRDRLVVPRVFSRVKCTVNIFYLSAKVFKRRRVAGRDSVRRNLCIGIPGTMADILGLLTRHFGEREGKRSRTRRSDQDGTRDASYKGKKSAERSHHGPLSRHNVADLPGHPLSARLPTHVGRILCESAKTSARRHSPWRKGEGVQMPCGRYVIVVSNGVGSRYRVET